MEITTALVIKQIVIAVLIAVGVAAAYTALAFAIAAYLHENSKNYPEVK